MRDNNSTPLVNSRRRLPNLLNDSSRRPTTTTATTKTVHWRLPTQSKSPLNDLKPDLSSSSIDAKESSSDLLGRLSLALGQVRTLKEQLLQRDNDLEELRVEKEKYQSDHGKVYSQLSSIRSKCQAFEGQLSKKAEQVEELLKANEELSKECTKLRSIIAEDTSKQTLKIKNLENQLRAAKDELSLKQGKDDLQLTIENLKAENGRLVKENEKRLEFERNEKQRIIKEMEELGKVTNELTKKVEESRSAMMKLSTEKSCLVQDIQRLKEEQNRIHQFSDQNDELQKRLAELETERSNAKTALKKAMAVLDQEEQIKLELERKESRIKELENELKSRSIQLPSIEALSGSLNNISISTPDEKSQPTSSPVIINDSTTDLVQMEKKVGGFMSRLNDIKNRVSMGKNPTESNPPPSRDIKFALPMAPIKVRTKDDDDDVNKTF